MLKSAGAVTASGGTPVWLSMNLIDAVVGSLTTPDSEAYRGVDTPAVFEQARADNTDTRHTDTRRTQGESGGA